MLISYIINKIFNIKAIIYFYAIIIIKGVGLKMKLRITLSAQEWFKREIDIPEGSGIRFYGKAYGKTPVFDGFSIAMSVEAPSHPMAEHVLEGITYFIEDTDDWFFNGYDLVVDYNQQKDEPDYQFIPEKK